MKTSEDKAVQPFLKICQRQVRGWLENWRFSRCQATVLGRGWFEGATAHAPVHGALGQPEGEGLFQAPRNLPVGLWRDGAGPHHLSLLLSFLSTLPKHKWYISASILVSSITFLLIFFSPLSFPPPHWLNQNTFFLNLIFCFLNTNCWYLYSDLAERGHVWQKDGSY